MSTDSITKNDDDAEKYDDDALSLQPTEQWAKRFKLIVRILLVPAALWFAWCLAHYLSHGGLALSVEDPYYFAPLVLATVALVPLVLLEVLKPLDQGKPRRIRKRFGIVSLVTTLLCIAGIIMAWAFVYGKDARDQLTGPMVTSTQQVEQYLEKNGQAYYTKIPTGVFVQSIEFKGTSNVAMSGYVWQRIPKNLQKGFKEGVIFPEADEVYSAKDVVYEEDQGDRTLKGWYFKGEFRQKFDYKSFPLDKQNVWLRMWPTDFNTKTMLVPDFEGYPGNWNPAKNTALDPLIVTGEWNTDFTGYSYVTNDYSSTFGYKHPEGISGSSTPEMYFNVGLKRDPQGPLYGQLIRWLFIAAIVFSALFLITIDEGRREVVGFTTFELMSFAVGMLLVIVFDQVAIREATGAAGIVYLEYFSYALYAMILMVGINAMLLTAKIKLRALHWGGNLLPKLLYWPAYFGLVLLATMAAFF